MQCSIRRAIVAGAAAAGSFAGDVVVWNVEAMWLLQMGAPDCPISFVVCMRRAGPGVAGDRVVGVSCRGAFIIACLDICRAELHCSVTVRAARS